MVSNMNCVFCTFVLILVFPWAQCGVQPDYPIFMKRFFEDQLQRYRDFFELERDPYAIEAVSMATNMFINLLDQAKDIREWLELTDDQINEISKKWADNLSQPIEEILTIAFNQSGATEDSGKRLRQIKHQLEKYREFLKKIFGNFLHRLQPNES